MNTETPEMARTAEKFINPVLWSALGVFMVFMVGVVISVFQIDQRSAIFERKVAQELALALAGESDAMVVQAFTNAGFIAVEIIDGAPEPEQMSVSVVSPEGLRRGSIVFVPQRPGSNTFLSTIGYKAPFILIALTIFSWFLIRLKRQTRILEAGRKHARRMAMTDGLTGIANRTRFNAVLDAQLTQLAASQQNLALYFIDIDNFKQINDRFGHGVGDALLVHMAQIARDIAGPTDLVARLAGDEFAILCKNSGGAKSAMAFAERLVHRMNNRIHIEDIGIDTSISVGVAIARSIDKLERNIYCQNADMALYAAKRSGRNGAALYSEITENMLQAPSMLKI